MKKLLLFTLTLGFLTLVSCTKETANNAKIVRNCLGTFVTIDGNDYYVCNANKLADFEDGEQINIKYKNVTDCGFIGACMLYHEKQGDIEITKVK